MGKNAGGGQIAMVNFWLGLLVSFAGIIWLWQHYRRVHSQWQKRAQQAEQTLQEVQRELTAVVQQYQAATQNLQELEHDHQLALVRIQALETENQKLERESQHYQQQVQHLEQNCQQLHNQLNQIQHNYQDALNYVKQLEQETEQWQEQVDQLLEYVGNGKINQRLEVSPSIQQIPHVTVIFKRTESDLYPDEIYDTILSVLKTHMDSLPDDYRRRHHILRDILACNSFSGNRDRFQQEIKSLFTSYQGKTERLVRDLGVLGFEFLDSPNHYKIKWRGDDRYIFSFAKTPSDYRAGANIARDLIRLLF